jgi:arsenate reductase
MPDRAAHFEGTRSGFRCHQLLQVPFKKSDLIELLRKLALHPRDILRKEEPVARRLGLCKKVLPDDALLDLMTQHPDLIQRPIVVRGNQATLGRPPENVKKLL